MTGDANHSEVISPATATAIALARLIRDELRGGSQTYREASGLGFGYTDNDNALAIVVDWHGLRRLEVIAPNDGTNPRSVQPSDDGGPWIKEMKAVLSGLQQVIAARKVRSGNPVPWSKLLDHPGWAQP